MIREETQNDKNHHLGMFVFIIMSHGLRGDILLDRDNQPIDLMKIRDLLSPHHFPAMKGKPKLMVVQACSGSKSNMIFEYVNSRITTQNHLFIQIAITAYASVIAFTLCVNGILKCFGVTAVM